MDDKIAFFLPTRKGSLRVKNKNTRRFVSFPGGLLENKLTQLANSKLIDELILSTNDEECILIAEKLSVKLPKLKIVERPDELCLDTTDLKDLIAYVPTITNAKHILWGHVTTPLFGAEDYDLAISAYLEKIKVGYDSVISVTEFKNFLLNKEAKIVNNTTSLPWPRTQDLETLYEINHAVFLTNREVYQNQQNRVGTKPFLHVTEKMKSVDVDWEEDFKIAEIIYEKYYGL
jgi:CMP-N-acetylneuraminic acid synthetase